MPAEKLTAADIGQHFREGYVEVARRLDDYEVWKARFLVDVGRKCLTLVREVLEPLPEHDLVARKAARAKIIREIEEQLPEADGIGVPQVNRWIRWAGAEGVLCGETPPSTGLAGLKQAHLMVLEKFFDQHESSGAFRLKEPWQTNLDEVRACIQITIETKAPAADLEAAIDAEAVFPKPPEEPCQKTTESAASSADKPSSSSSSKKSTTEPRSPASSGEPSKPASQPSKPSAQNKASISTGSSQPSTSSSSALADLSPKALSDQAFKLLQQPEILAGVFRREWTPELVLSIVDNLIRAAGEDSKNTLGLAKAYHRAKPFILTHFEEYAEDGKFKLRKKDQPEAPTLEQLAPAGELANA